MKNIVVLVSGGGTNLQRIIDCIDNGEIPNANISLVVADRDCYGLERGKNYEIPTVHYVTSGIDEGKIILQKSFEISENETLETLAEKIHAVEYEIFPRAINKVLGIPL